MVGIFFTRAHDFPGKKLAGRHLGFIGRCVSRGDFSRQLVVEGISKLFSGNGKRSVVSGAFELQRSRADAADGFREDWKADEEQKDGCNFHDGGISFSVFGRRSRCVVIWLNVLTCHYLKMGKNPIRFSFPKVYEGPR